MDEWTEFLENMDKGGAVNLNIFSEYHQKSRKYAGATLGVDMEVDEIAIIYLEENATAAFRWQIAAPMSRPAENGNPGPMGNGLDYHSHVFEIVSTEYRPKPTLPGMLGVGGIRIFAIRGRRPNEVELAEALKEKLRKQFAEITPAAHYITSLNTDYLKLQLKGGDEAPVWTENIEITVLSNEEYDLNFFLQ